MLEAVLNRFWWWRLLAPQRRRLAGGLGATVLCSVAAAWVPFWSGRAVHALEQSHWHQSRVALGWMLVFTALAGLGRYLMRNTLIGLSRTLETRQREALFDFLLSRPAAFYERQRVGDLMSRIGDDIGTVRMATGPGLMSILQVASMLPMTLGLMLHTSPLLASAVLAPFLFLALTFYAVGRWSHRIQQRLQLVASQLTTFSHETISGEKVVQAFGLEAQRIAIFQKLSRLQASLNIRQAVLSGSYAPLSMLVAGASALILVGLGGRLVLQHRLNLGDLTAFTGYLAALSWPVMSLGWAANLFQRGRAGQERIDQILASPELDLATASSPASNPRPCALELQKISHRFDNGRGLGPLDLAISPGGSLAIVGSIGSGKSLLLQLLTGLRAPQHGTILLDGSPLNATSLRAHWSGLGWVPQEAFLFSTSLRENLTLGWPEAPEEAIQDVIRVVCLDTLIPRLSFGLDTVVGERGVVLSGGERQRAALARALLRRPRLLLLDDALSAVDADTESQILSNLRAFLGQTTLILATHRIFVAELCEQVLVLEEGRMLQYGSPQNLAEEPGLFAHLKRLQSLEQELEGIIPPGTSPC